MTLRRASRFALALGCAALGCSAARHDTRTASGAAKAPSSAASQQVEDPAPPGPARAFPPTARGDTSLEAWEADGSRRLIAQGVRLIERPGGALEVADEFLPAARGVAPVALPARLGGGYVFGVNVGSEGLLWRSTGWTSALRPLARFDGEIERIVPGFDRLYVLRARGAPWIALDMDNGRALDLGSLPPSPNYGAMLFADEWLAVVNVPLRGVLATFDAGGSWHPLGLGTATLTKEDTGVRLEGDGRRFLLGVGGSLSPFRDNAEPAAAVAPPRRPGARLRTPEPLGPRPLEVAVLHGFREAGGTALVAARGALARVRLSDGAILDLAPKAYGGQAPCDAVTLGSGAGFVCGEPHAATTVYALSEGLTLKAAFQFDEPRRVAQNGRGALIVDGSCGKKLAPGAVRCVIPSSGAPFERRVLAPEERAVALADGGLAVLLPLAADHAQKSEAGAPKRAAEEPAPSPAKKPKDEPIGRLTLVHHGAVDQTLSLRLSDVDDDAARSLVETGFWLDSFEQAPNGDLRGWIAGAATFVGVRVKLDGRVLVGSPEPHLERALLSGRFGIVVGRARSMRETIDGGFEWTDAELPAEPDLRPDKTYGVAQGCSALGCAFAGWLRVGWTRGETPRLSLATLPEPTHLFGTGSNRWSLDCRASGEQSRPALRQSPQPEDRSVSPWNPLAEVAPPSRARADAAYEMLNEAELDLFHAYAWGPSGDGWAREGRFQIRVRDPYRVTDAVWSTAPSPPVWSSAALTADAFGRSPSGPPATWRIVSDPIKHAGLLLVSEKGVLELYFLQEARPITRIKTTGALGVVTSVALAAGRFYVSALGEGRSLRLYRVEAGALELLGEFPDIDTRAEAPTLAPATQGDGIAVWVHDADFFLYPFDLATRRFDPPIVTRARDMATMPPSCTTGEDGYVIGDAVSLEPNVDLQGVPDGVTTGNGIEVRLIVGPSRVCVDGLAAPLGLSSREGNHPPGSSAAGRGNTRGILSGVRAPSSEPKGETPPHGVSERDSDPGAPLVLDFPDGARRGFRCRD